jgi:uncharacterized protein
MALNPRGIKGITIYLTNRCNLECSFCFVSKNEERMPESTAKSCVDFLIGNSGDNKELEIIFFGGEPLLEFGLIKKIVDYSKARCRMLDKKIIFGIITNGTLFNEDIAGYFRENKIRVTFSWDGDRERIVKIKSSVAYGDMLDSIGLLKKNGVETAARMTISPDDMRLVEYVRAASDAGFESISLFPVERGLFDKEETEEAMLKLADLFIEELDQEKILRIFPMEMALLIILGIKIRPERLCGIGKDQVGITVDGQVIPCHHPETWLRSYSAGNVSGKKTNLDKFKVFREFDNSKLKGCEKCEVKEYCWGSCLSTNLKANGDMLVPWEGGCVWNRATIRAAKHIIDELYTKKKNERFIRWVMKIYTDKNCRKANKGQTGSQAVPEMVQEMSKSCTAEKIQDGCTTCVYRTRNLCRMPKTA